MKNKSKLISTVTGIAIIFVIIGAYFFRKNNGQANSNVRIVNFSNQNKTGNFSNNSLKKEDMGAVLQTKDDQTDIAKYLNMMLNDASGGRGVGAFVVDDKSKNSAEYVKSKLKSIMMVPEKGIKSFFLAGKSGGIKLKSKNDFEEDKSFSIKPVYLANSDLNKSTFTGYMATGTYLDNKEKIHDEKVRSLNYQANISSGWTGITRVFDEVPDLGRVILEETDTVAGNMVVAIPKSAINYQVANFPATISKVQDSSGNGITTIRWIQDNRLLYSIKTEGLSHYSADKLSRIANTIAEEKKPM